MKRKIDNAYIPINTYFRYLQFMYHSNVLYFIIVTRKKESGNSAISFVYVILPPWLVLILSARGQNLAEALIT